MRLLRRDEDGEYEFEYFTDRDIVPKYATLSHRWTTEEVSYADVETGRWKQKLGYKKIEFCGKQAAKDKLRYIWVDTCCINKQDAPELQEAVISMFRWYQEATKCYVYLSDVSATEDNLNNSLVAQPWETPFRQSKWFTRGWTLQELLAPVCVEFYSQQGALLGDKSSMRQLLVDITGIPPEAIGGVPPGRFTIEERFSWAEKRETTRAEDKAYSLLGLFDIQIPLLYGEGERRAFKRLRAKIEKNDAERVRLDNLANDLPTSSAAAFNSSENQYKQYCLPNTRIEVLRHIGEWADGLDDRYIYWLNGIAGMGKSTIARTIAKAFDGRGILGGTFFFSKDNSDANRAEKLMTTLASQMARRIPSVKPHICDAINENQDITTQSLRDQWDKLIIRPLSRIRSGEPRPSTIVLVIDALDECESARDIRMVLSMLATSEKLRRLRLRVLITSRPEIPIRGEFGKIPEADRQGYVLHEISSTLVDRDLRIFFEKRFRDLREERGLSSDWPTPNVISRLVETSCGLFIWASTAWLWIQKHARAMKTRVNKLVNGHFSRADAMKRLDEIYITVLEDSIRPGRSDEEDPDELDELQYDDDERAELLGNLRKILGTIVVLSSPLSLNSLAILLDVETELITDTLADLHAILHIPEETNRPIRLHHPTFRDFLLDAGRCTKSDFCIDEKVAQDELAENCVRLMSKSLHFDVCSLQFPGMLAKDIERSQLEQHITPELQYACLYWAEHFRRGGIHLRDDDDTHEFFQQHFLHWLEMISLMGKSSKMAAIIRMYQSLLVPVDNSRQIEFVKDARRFMFAFHSEIERAPLQTYMCALLFIQPSNRLRDHFWAERHPWLKAGRVVGAIASEAKDEYNYVNDLAFSPDGRHLASGSLEPSVRVWKIHTRLPLTRYEGQTDKISSVAISPNGKMLASGSDDSTVMVWSMPEKRTLWILSNHTRWVNTVAFSPDGCMLASGSMDETIRLWSMETGEELAELSPELSCINSLAFSPRGDVLASGTVDHSIPLYEIGTKSIRLMLDGHAGPVNSVHFSPDGKRLVSGSDDLTVRIWDTVRGTELVQMKGHHKKIWAVSYSPNASTIASGSEDKTIRLWNATTGAQTHKIQGHSSGVNAVVYSPDKRLLASGSFNDEVKLWDAKTGAARGELADFEQDATAGASQNEGDDAESPQSDLRFAIPAAHAGVITQLVISERGRCIASGSDDSVIKMWTKEGTELSSLHGHSGSINHMIFSSEGTFLASASSDKTARVWNVTSGQAVCTLRGHNDDVRRVRFSPDERYVATCSADGAVGLWDATSGRNLHNLDHHADTVNDIAFSPDGRFIASCSNDRTICIWNVRSPTRSYRKIEAHDDAVNSVAFSADGELILSASSDTSIKSWDLTGTMVNKFNGHTLPVLSCTFTNNMKSVVSGSTDGTIRVWNTETGIVEYLQDVNTPVSSVSVSDCGQYILTDRGLLRTEHPLEMNRTAPQGANALFVTRDWVRCNSHDVLYIPTDFNAASVAVWDDTVILGHDSGSISFVRLFGMRSITFRYDLGVGA